MSTINKYAYCTALEVLNIPASVKSIGYDAFAYCKLSEVYYNTIEPINVIKNIFFKLQPETTLFMPAEALEIIDDYSPWKDFPIKKAWDAPVEISEIKVCVNDSVLTTYNMLVGDEVVIDISAIPDNAAERMLKVMNSDQNIVVSSTDEIDGKGQLNLTALAEGTSTVIVASTDGSGTQAVLTVNVSLNLAIAIPVEERGVLNEDGSLPEGESVMIYANTFSPVVWSISDASPSSRAMKCEGAEIVATYENPARAEIRGLKSGTDVIITALLENGDEQTFTLTIGEPVGKTSEPFSINPSDVALTVGSRLSLSTKGDGGKKIVWRTSDSFVAQIDENGVITAIAPGTAIITATIEGTSTQATIRATVFERTTGIEEAEASEPVVKAENLSINVSGIASDLPVEIYNVSGRLIASRKGSCSVAVGQTGIYIVRIGGIVRKVAVTR